MTFQEFHHELLNLFNELALLDILHDMQLYTAKIGDNIHFVGSTCAGCSSSTGCDYNKYESTMLVTRRLTQKDRTNTSYISGLVAVGSRIRTIGTDVDIKARNVLLEECTIFISNL